jgi:hypothetical protein
LIDRLSIGCVRATTLSYWCYGPGCHDPVPGASEIDKNQQADMGLTDAEIEAIAVAWRANMDAVHKA